MKIIYTILILLTPFVGFGQLTYVPDDNFEQKLINLGYDEVLDDYVSTTNIINIQSLDLSDYPNDIVDLTGIEDFSNLEYLFIQNNDITNLDLSNNLSLIEIDLRNNELEFINLGLNSNLQKLRLDDHFLEILDFTNTPNIVTLMLGDGQVLNQLNVNNCLNLDTLWLNNHNLTSIDLTNNVNISSFSTYGDYLEFININNGYNYLIENFRCFNESTCIKVDNLEDIPSISYTTNNFTLDCDGEQTYVPDNNFEQYLIDSGYDFILDNYVYTSHIVDIEEFGGVAGPTGIIDFEGIQDFISIESINIGINHYTTSNLLNKISNLNGLKNLEIYHIYQTGSYNSYVDFDLTNASYKNNLENLTIDFTRLDNLNISDFSSLQFFDFSSLLFDENITFNLNNCSTLVTVDCSESDVYELSINNCHSLENLKFFGSILNYENCSSLKNIEIQATDNINLSNQNFQNLEVLRLDNVTLNDLFFQNNLSLKELYLYSNQTYYQDNFDVSNCTMLEKIEVVHDGILDLSNLPMLTHVKVGGDVCYLDLRNGNNEILNIFIYNNTQNLPASTPPCINVSNPDFFYSNMCGYTYCDGYLENNVNFPERTYMGDYITYSNDCQNSFNCINGSCLELFNESGEFLDLIDCDLNSDCEVVFENTWNCVNNACVDPMDGTGFYDDLNECEAVCNVVIAESWNCVNNACVDPMDGTGFYDDLNECEAVCNIVIEDSWNCVNDACVDPLDGSGEFSTLNDCEQVCQNISSINENLIDVNIFPNPSSNIFNLEFNSDSETEILVTNILGEKIYFESTQSSREFKTQIDLSNFSKGIYNLTVKTYSETSNHRLILQ